ncbi:hypothetical protein QFZ22_002575 [Streptomyces canus]|uniref:Uncharacterized protein n=1 Tax=Streptomyces canus TaxID=58343 RepID=A0AAW8FBQ4_9ACTN|nr:hypothetical protein [Streptomyces canus]MDQ0906590.1 hypothetical protein [Streptomyces canus]
MVCVRPSACRTWRRHTADLRPSNTAGGDESSSRSRPHQPCADRGAGRTLGSVSRLVPDPDLDSTALALAVEFAEEPTKVFTPAKRLLSAGERNALRQHLEEEARLIAALPDGEPARTRRTTSFLPARTAGGV